MIATYNPVSYLIEGIRSLHHHRVGRARRWRSGFGLAIAIAASALAAASGALRTRLVRT